MRNKRDERNKTEAALFLERGSLFEAVPDCGFSRNGASVCDFGRSVYCANRYEAGVYLNVEELVNQLIQGSVLLDPYPIFPYATRVNQVAVTEEGVLIDLSSEAAETALPVETAAELVKKNVSDNFSGYGPVTVTVNGNDPVVVNKLLEEKDSEH